MSRELKIINEIQLNSIVREVLKVLTHDDSSIIKKHILDEKISNIGKIVNSLNRVKQNTYKSSSFLNSIYVKVENESDDIFEFHVSIGSDRMEVDNVSYPENVHSYGLIVSHRFLTNNTIGVVCNYNTEYLNKIIPEIEVSYVTINSQKYLKLTHSSSVPRCLWMDVTVKNEGGNIEIFDNISGSANISKSKTIPLYSTTGFIDIENRDKIVRSDSIKRYEIVSQSEYIELENAGLLEETTMYSIPEGE